jgi:hypothetical protein
VLDAKVTMLLADHAQVADGKLYISGGAWRVATPGAPFAIAGVIEVPWDLSGQEHSFRFELRDLDGQLVTTEMDNGETQEMAVDGAFEVGRPPGHRPGARIPFPFAINLPSMNLEPGGDFVWQLQINGEEREEWRLLFRSFDPDEMQSEEN